jgi:hypothetical protein
VALDYPVPYLLFGLGVGIFCAYRKAASGAVGGSASTAAAGSSASGSASAAAAGGDATSVASGATSVASGGASGGAASGSASGGASGSTAAARARTNPARIIAAMLTGGTLRLVSHLLSGVLFFAEYAGDQNVWIYSLTYNVSYLAPSLIASAVCALVLMPILDRSVPVQPKG